MWTTDPHSQWPGECCNGDTYVYFSCFRQYQQHTKSICIAKQLMQVYYLSFECIKFKFPYLYVSVKYPCMLFYINVFSSKQGCKHYTMDGKESLPLEHLHKAGCASYLFQASALVLADTRCQAVRQGAVDGTQVLVHPLQLPRSCDVGCRENTCYNTCHTGCPVWHTGPCPSTTASQVQ